MILSHAPGRLVNVTSRISVSVLLDEGVTPSEAQALNLFNVSLVEDTSGERLDPGSGVVVCVGAPYGSERGLPLRQHPRPPSPSRPRPPCPLQTTPTYPPTYPTPYPSPRAPSVMLLCTSCPHAPSPARPRGPAQSTTPSLRPPRHHRRLCCPLASPSSLSSATRTRTTGRSTRSMIATCQRSTSPPPPLPPSTPPSCWTQAQREASARWQPSKATLASPQA